MDELANLFNITKISTAGDNATFIFPFKNIHSLEKVLIFAFCIIYSFKDFRRFYDDEIILKSCRIGLSYGKLQYGLFGSIKQLNIFGEVVETAKELESNSRENEIQVCEVTFKALKKSLYPVRFEKSKEYPGYFVNIDSMFFLYKKVSKYIDEYKSKKDVCEKDLKNKQDSNLLYWLNLPCFFELRRIVKNIKQKTIEIKKEGRKNEDLLKFLLPEEVINEIIRKRGITYILNNNTAVCFVKVYENNLEKLNQIYCCFDEEIKRSEGKIIKIKSIGNLYLFCGCSLKPKFSNEKKIINVVNCVLSLYNMSKKFTKKEISVGIDAGSIIGGVIGLKMNYDIFGTCVNRSFRICSIRRSGIKISRDVFLCLNNELKKEFGFLGEIKLKGFSEKVEIYQRNK